MLRQPQIASDTGPPIQKPSAQNHARKMAFVWSPGRYLPPKSPQSRALYAVPGIDLPYPIPYTLPAFFLFFPPVPFLVIPFTHDPEFAPTTSRFLIMSPFSRPHENKARAQFCTSEHARADHAFVMG